MLPARQRLEKFLAERSGASAINIEQLTSDASTREYFRISWEPKTAIACVYPVQNDPQERNYIDVTNLFLSAALPVARIFEVDSDLAIIIHEDFGDKILRGVLESSQADEKEKWLHESIRLIAKIQAATDKAYELNSIASKLRFDEEKLLWELNFFKTHYF